MLAIDIFHVGAGIPGHCWDVKCIAALDCGKVYSIDRGHIFPGLLLWDWKKTEILLFEAIILVLTFKIKF